MGFSGNIQRRGSGAFRSGEDMQLCHAGAVGELHLYHRFFPSEFLAGNAADRLSGACHVPGLNEILCAAGEQHFSSRPSPVLRRNVAFSAAVTAPSAGRALRRRSQPIIQPCRETPRADCEALAAVALPAGVKLAQRRHRARERGCTAF